MEIPWLQVISPRTTKGGEAEAVEAKERKTPEAGTGAEVEAAVVMLIVISEMAEVTSHNISTRHHHIFNTHRHSSSTQEGGGNSPVKGAANPGM